MAKPPKINGASDLFFLQKVGAAPITQYYSTFRLRQKGDLRSGSGLSTQYHTSGSHMMRIFSTAILVFTTENYDLLSAAIFPTECYIQFAAQMG